jgi:hypothetical protein
LYRLLVTGREKVGGRFSNATCGLSRTRCRSCAKELPIAKRCAILSPVILFSEILEAEEDHVDFIETQLDLITKIGIENYIQLQSGHAG